MSISVISRILLPLFLTFFSVVSLSGQSPGSTAASDITSHDTPTMVADSLQHQVDSLFARYDTTGSPGAIVGVMQDGELIFAKGYGMADIPHSIPITPETRFNIASISKQFTGFGFAMLAKQGSLSLQDPARKHLPELPQFDHEVTLRHMLTHTSGYREAYGTLALRGLLASRDYLSREEALAVIERQPALEYIPGSNWKYNSTAYVVLAMILEEVTGESFPAWMNEYIFDPVGMKRTVIEDEVGEVIPGAATSYYYEEEDSTYTTAFSNRAIFGSAEIYTTIGDLAKWMQNFHTAEVGGPEVQDMLREPFVLSNGDTTHYGLGISVDRERGLKRVHHSGAHAAYGSKLNYYPELNAGVIVMTNHGDINASRKVRKIARIFFGKHMDLEKEEKDERTPYMELDSELMGRYAGRYKTNTGDVITLEKRNNSLLLRSSPDTRRVLHPLSETEFQSSNNKVSITFPPSAPDQSVDKATLRDSVETTLTRIPYFNPSLQALKKYTGRYLSPELETIYTIATQDRQLVAKHRLLGELTLTPDTLAVQNGTFETRKGTIQPTIQFERNKMGIITGFYATLWGTKDVWFQRME